MNKHVWKCSGKKSCCRRFATVIIYVNVLQFGCILYSIDSFLVYVDCGIVYVFRVSSFCALFIPHFQIMKSLTSIQTSRFCVAV